MRGKKGIAFNIARRERESTKGVFCKRFNHLGRIRVCREEEWGAAVLVFHVDDEFFAPEKNSSARRWGSRLLLSRERIDKANMSLAAESMRR